MNHYRVSELDAQRAESQKSYLEFLRSQSLSVGLYVLSAGEADLQQPHTEDEVYYVIRGRSRFKAGDEDRSVERGSVLFVEAGVEHRFHAIQEDLEILVFFAPPEGSTSE